MSFKIRCPHCGETCEIDFEPEVGQHVICPYCNVKFSYGKSQGNGVRHSPAFTNRTSPSSLTKMLEEEKKWTVGRAFCWLLIAVPILIVSVWAALGFESPDYLLLLADQRWVSRQLGNRYLLCSCYTNGDNIEICLSPIRSDIYPSPELVDRLRSCRCGQEVWPDVFGEDIQFLLDKRTGEVKVLKGRRPSGWDDGFLRKLIQRCWRSYGYHAFNPSRCKIADEPHFINPVFEKSE